jgi:cell division septation protein DedD
VFDVGKPIKPDFLFKPIITTAGKSDKAVSPVAKPASKPAKAKAAPKPKPAAAAPQPKEYWSIVLCSRVGLKNAEIYAEMIHKDGFSEAVVIDKETNAKVVYGKYPSKEEAQNALRQLRDNKYFKIGWLLKITE